MPPAVPKASLMNMPPTPSTVRELWRRVAPITFDWHDHHCRSPRPCRYCARPAIMRDDTDRPCHKFCAETEQLWPGWTAVVHGHGFDAALSWHPQGPAHIPDTKEPP